MPALLSIIGGVLFFIIFPKAFDSEFLTLRGLIEAGALEKLEAQGLTIPIYILISSIQAITFAPFFNMFTALGEEVGWRGVLYPYLKEKLGVTKGRIVGGVIWGFWHWPVMIFAGYEYGKEYIGAPAYLTKPEYADMAIFGPAYIGIISMSPMLIMAVIICVKQKRNCRGCKPGVTKGDD